MNFLEKYSNSDYILKIYVKPNSRIQKIVNNEDFITIFLKSKPIENKANKELITLIKKRLNISSTQIRIISGSKKQDKLIKLSLSDDIKEQELVKKLIK
ncbi:MAG: DUF167 domain-containing protein [Candidatus Odinarchaeota archaeon]